MPISPFFSIVVGTLAFILFTPLNARASTLLSDQLQKITQGEVIAKEKCDALIHFDTLKFEPCINKLAKEFQSEPYNQLGILYAGYVSALNYSHSGLPGAKLTAWKLAKHVQPLQKKLGIDAYDLCSSLPGNCDLRIKTTERILQTGRPKTGPIPNNQHNH